MKKTLSLFLSIVMLFSITSGIDLTASAANRFEIENNNNFSKATVATVGVDISGTISGAYNNNDLDYYKYQVDNEGKFSVKFLHDYSSFGGWNFSLFKYNKENNSYDIITKRTAKCNEGAVSILNIGLKAGDIVFVLVELEYNDGCVGVNYTLNTSFTQTTNYETEFNNTFNSANNLALNTTVSGSNYGVYNDKDLDYYVFNVPTNQKVTLKFTHTYNNSGGWKIIIYKYNSNNRSYDTIKSTSISAKDGALTFSDITAGKYYVLVSLDYNDAAIDLEYHLNAHMHTYKTTTTKATLTKNGNIVNKCSICGAKKSSTTIYYPKTIKLNRNTFTTNGKVQRPSVTVYDSKGKQLTYKKDFTVDYSNWSSKNVGRYTVTVKMIGNYGGTKTFPYYINPKPTEFVPSNKGGFKAISKGFTLKWNKQASQTTGYQIQYATKRDFSNAATITIANPNTTSKTIKGRAGNTRYYVRVRTYKKIGNGTFYSNWNSGVKSVVTLR